MKPEERLLLIDSLLDGSISEADLLRIEAELSVDPEVRQEYYRRLQLEMLLERQVAEGLPGEATATATSVSSRSPWTMFVAGSLLAIAASLLVMFVSRSSNRSGVAGEDTLSTAGEPSASGFAVLNGQDGAVWEGTPITEGDLLPSGELHLKSGRVHIELFSGVQMVLAGNSLFSIDSPMQVTMLRGTARTRVPEPAQGFRIKTSSGDVVDLGTEFSIAVDDKGADVHVVDGEVELHPDRSDSLRIDAGLSRRLASSGTVTDALSPRPETVGPSEFQDLLQLKQRLRLSTWADSNKQIQSDSRAVAYYQFDSARLQSRQVENLAAGAKQPASDGTIVATTQATDRWGRSDAALDFSRVGSRVRVHVPGQHRGLTLLCWVKINSLDRWYNSLFLTDGHEDGEPHWQLMDDGRIFFSVKVPLPESGNRADSVQPVFYSPKIWDASLSGRWIMLAVTYDVDQTRVTHYLNGKPISSTPISDDALVESIHIGSASICNWSEPMYRTDPKFVIRNLNGSMDEFALYSGALADDEIWQLYRVGNPNER